MELEEFEKIFGNVPFENIKLINQYIDKNYISKDKIREKIEQLREIHKDRDFTQKEGFYLDCYEELLGDDK